MQRTGCVLTVLQAIKAKRTTRGHNNRIRAEVDLSPSTAAAARFRERRGGPGGPRGLLLGPARPSYTSCRWGALKGFARARCATDENIFLKEQDRGSEERQKETSGQTKSQEPSDASTGLPFPASAPLRRSCRPPQKRLIGPTAKVSSHGGSAPCTCRRED